MDIFTIGAGVGLWFWKPYGKANIAKFVLLFFVAFCLIKNKSILDFPANAQLFVKESSKVLVQKW